MIIHIKDEDCAAAGQLDADGNCTACGVSADEPCPRCKGVRFHDSDCPRSDAACTCPSGVLRHRARCPQETTDPRDPEQREYRVRWEIDVYAENPEAAARAALYIQAKEDSIAHVFDVWERASYPRPSKAVKVDLDEIDEQRNSCRKCGRAMFIDPVTGSHHGQPGDVDDLDEAADDDHLPEAAS